MVMRSDKGVISKARQVLQYCVIEITSFMSGNILSKDTHSD